MNRHNRSIASLAVIVLAGLSLAVPQWAPAQSVSPQYSIIDVPFSSPIFGYSTSATGINDRGQIVGSYVSDVHYGFAYTLSGFVYDHGVYTSFDVPGTPSFGVNQTYANGINNLGQIIGSYYDSDPEWGDVLRGFLYDHGVITTLSPPDVNGLETQARGINDRGQIVGFYFDLNFTIRGFMYDHGVYTHIDFPGAVDTRAFGINNRGEIVGFYYDSNWHAHVFLYDHGAYTVLEDPAAAYSDPSINPLGINDRGQIVGSDFDDHFVAHGFLYDHGVYTRFDAPNAGVSLNNYSGTFATGINARGEIVGYAFGKKGPPAFVLSRSGSI